MGCEKTGGIDSFYDELIIGRRLELLKSAKVEGRGLRRIFITWKCGWYITAVYY